MTTVDLSSGWSLRATGGDVPAEVAAAVVPAPVPGDVHTALLAAGLVPDPYLDANEQALAWVHGADWEYRRPLVLDPPADDEEVELVLDGLDTVADVLVGEQRVLAARNMHRGYRVDVRALADGVERDLVVALGSATAWSDARSAELGERPAAYPNTFNAIRKMACSYGWDWGPDLRTAGIWKPVRVERWRVARLERVRPFVDVTDLAPDGTTGAGRLVVHVDVRRSALREQAPVVVEVEAAGHGARVEVPAGETTAVVTLDVPDAPVWWPVGYGDQPLVAVDVALATPDGDRLDAWRRAVGFRTVRLDTTPDEHGTPFVLHVNERPVLVHGANWIPDDHLLPRLARDRLARRLDQAVGAHLNLLRVWGGGVYESDDFYDLADERGLLVWQDFLLACAAYPEDAGTWAEIEAEARENVARLVPHPSLVLWNGGNENLWGHEDWGWKERLGDLTWGEGYARDLLPRVVAEVDPTRPYTDNSPFSPGRPDLHPNDPDHGTHHQWQVWNQVDYRAYRDEVPRFCSEFGFQGPPTWRTLTEAVHAVDGGPLADAPEPTADPVWLVHQKAHDGNGKLDRGMAPHLGVPARFEDWHWAAQLNQARAVAHAIEHYRSWWPRTAGAIVWQLNDCWPVTSWSAVDAGERPKPLWYALRRASAPRTLAVVARDGTAHVAIANDHDEPWIGALSTRLERLDGSAPSRTSVPVAVAPRSVALVPVDPALAAPDDPTDAVLVVDLGNERLVHTFVEDVDLRLDPGAVEARVERVPGGYRVHVRARSLVRDLTVLADRLAPDAVSDDALVSLPAGSTATITVTTAAELDPAALLAAPVLRSANDLRAVPQREPAAVPEPAPLHAEV